MSRVIMFRNENDVDDFKKSGKKTKHGLAMIMQAIENDDLRSAKKGLEEAWKGVKTMCEIAEDMEEQFSERREGDVEMRGSYGNRSYEDWNRRDDEWMNQRVNRM